MAALPPLAAFPSGAWRELLITDGELDGLLIAYTTLCQAYAALQTQELVQKVDKDASVTGFLVTFMEEMATNGIAILGPHATPLLKAVMQLLNRILSVASPAELLTFDFVANTSRVYPKKVAAPIVSRIFITEKASIKLESSLLVLKKLLIPQLDAGINGDLKLVEQRLVRLNPLLHVSPHACALFLAGSDFFDGLVSGFKVMNPPLRKVIVTTLYLGLIGLAEAEPPKWAMLSDQFYSLQSAADAHKQGPLNANDSLVAELVTSTPILRTISRKVESSGAANENLKKRVSALEGFKKGPMVRPKRLIKRRVDKGKGKESDEAAQTEMHVHKMSKITQVQDLFPDLGTGFVSKCLDEYGEDVERVIANLIEDSLPAHLASADRGEALYVGSKF